MVPLNFECLRVDTAMNITRPVLMILGHQEWGDEDEKLFLAVDAAEQDKTTARVKKGEKRIQLRLLVLSKIRGSILVRSSM